MKGVVVEIANLKNATHLNGQRGFITKVVSTTPLKYSICINDQLYKVKNEKTTKVYCLGIPKEYKISDDRSDPLQFFLGTLSQTKSKLFYAFPKVDGHKMSIVLINIKFFDMALQKMTTEPLLRVYITNKSHHEDDCKIVFDQCCTNPPQDMSYPWFVDLSSSQFLELVSRFESVDDEKELKNLNLHDFQHILKRSDTSKCDDEKK